MRLTSGYKSATGLSKQEAKTALVAILTQEGYTREQAEKLQNYIDLGVIAVTIGVGGYKFAVDAKRLAKADEALVKFDGATGSGERFITVPGPLNTPYRKMDYLLGKVPGNIDSIGKGGYLGGVLGFNSGDDLSIAMQVHLKDNFGNAVIKGNKVEVIAPMTGPNGVTVNVKAVWQVQSGRVVSFVTALPGPH